MQTIGVILVIALVCACSVSVALIVAAVIRLRDRQIPRRETKRE